MKELFLGQAGNYRAREVWRHLLARGSKGDMEALRTEFARHYKVPKGRVYLTANGRSAIALALQSCELPQGSRVMINGFTCYAVVQAVEAAGCVPVYADVAAGGVNFTAETLEKAYTEGVRALIIQNTMGSPVDITEIEKFAKKHKLVIIEDMAHVIGGKYPDGREMGTVGDAAAFSFGKGKAIDTITGGALIIRGETAQKLKQAPNKVPRLADQMRARLYPLLGMIGRNLARTGLTKYWYGPLIRLHLIERAVDARLDLKRRPANWQARLAFNQLRQIEQTVRRGELKPVREYAFVKKRAKLLDELEAKGYHFREIWYDVPVSPTRLYQGLNFPEAECPEAVETARTIVNIPTYYSERDLQGARELIEKCQIKEAETKEVDKSKEETETKEADKPKETTGQKQQAEKTEKKHDQ